MLQDLSSGTKDVIVKSPRASVRWLPSLLGRARDWTGSSIGRITTSGVVTNYTDSSIQTQARSPPDRTARCGS